MYVSYITRTEGDMVILMSRRPYWIFLNANGPHFAHPMKCFVLDLQKLISIDRKTLYNMST